MHGILEESGRLASKWEARLEITIEDLGLFYAPILL